MAFRLVLVVIFQMISTDAMAAGWIDHATYHQYEGWACQKGNEQPVGIHIWREDGVFLGGGNASNPREQAVAAACGTTSANHGFSIKLSISPFLIDNKYHKVSIYMLTDAGSELIENSPISIPFGKPNPYIEEPRISGTVVGRDLAVGEKLEKIRVGDIGHLGIWDGRRVIEMLNEGGDSKVKMSTWADFISRSKVWPSTLPRIPSSAKNFRAGSYSIEGCFSTQCVMPGSEYRELVPTPTYTTLSPKEAIIERARQIYLIGGKYTITAQTEAARPGTVAWSTAYCNPYSHGGSCPMKIETPPRPGIYRCDTLVLDAYATPALASWGTSISAKYTINNQSEYDAWHSRMNILANFTTRSPFKIMHALRSFQ